MYFAKFKYQMYWNISFDYYYLFSSPELKVVLGTTDLILSKLITKHSFAKAMKGHILSQGDT